jgi:hypothetical protein
METERRLKNFDAVHGVALEVTKVRNCAASLLSERSIQSFDGFGHFLDAVLGDDPQAEEALARAVRVSRETIDQLRASAVDPFAISMQSVVYLGFLVGIKDEEFFRLIEVDHRRFAGYGSSVFARDSQTTVDEGAAALRAHWRRCEEDLATEL